MWLLNIYEFRNCSSVGCLKCVQFHNSHLFGVSCECRQQKDFLGPLFKKLGNHSNFYEWNLGSNRAQKWRKLTVAETSSHSFRPLRSLRASFPFISVAERQRLKLGMLEEKDTNCSRRLWRKITCGDVKSVPKIFGGHSRDNLGPLWNPRYYSYDISMYIFLFNLIFSAGIWRTGLSV